MKPQSVAEIIAQSRRLAAMRSEAAARSSSWWTSAVGHQRPVDSPKNLADPVHMELLVLRRAIAQVKINQTLVRNSALL